MRELGSETLVAVVVPFFNEAENIRAFVEEVRAELGRLELAGGVELVLCNDGSDDGSGDVLDELATEHPKEVRVVHLARNFGHAAALTAGLAHTRADVVITMDGDMQDDPGAFAEFLEQWRAGYDVVYAIRTAREEHAVLRWVFWGFYRALRWMANVELPLDAGNFGLMDRKVVDSLQALPERNLYFPGLRAWVGFRQTGVEVPRRARYDRKSRVGLRGLWSLAGNAVFSFSYVPILLFRMAGMAAMLLFFLLIVYVLAARWVLGIAVGVADEMLIICFFCGINLMGIAILGEYIARIYDEVKGRPRYVVSRVSNQPSNTE